jgi:small conductance mechanosensitive channel
LTISQLLIAMTHKHLRSLPVFLLALLLVFAPASPLAETGDTPAQESEAVTTTESESSEAGLKSALEEIRSLEEKVKETAALYMKSEGEKRELAWAELSKLESRIDAELEKIVALFTEMQKNGLDTSDLKADVEKVLAADQKLLEQEIEEVVLRLELLSDDRKDADAAKKISILQSAQESLRSLGVMFNAMLKNTQRKESIGIDTTKDLELLDATLTRWADELSSRLSLLNKQKDAAESAYNKAAEGDKEALKSEVDEIKERHTLLTDSLAKTIEIMKKRDLETGEYSKLLITSTGKITQDIFSEGVAASLFSEWLGQARDWVMENGASIVFQLIVIALILLAFKFLSALISRVIARGFERSSLQVSHLFKEFAISISRKLVMLLGILVVLSQIGIDVGPMLAGLGVAGFVIGFALQNTLSNFASGMMILIYRPFDVGDAVEVDGVVGKVQAMTLVSTTVLTFDNQQLMIPNNNIWGNTIKNITARKVRRVDMTFGIGYSDDIEKAEEILWKIVKEHPLVLEDPEPVIKVSALGASSVDFVVRPWSNTADYWNVYWDITRSVKMEFDKAGVSIPFPQSDVHLYRHDLLEGGESKADAKE